jgi:2-polyprenyl-6-methoxyphenol hydroxylase-like FAD-dependent oxidoreductase
VLREGAEDRGIPLRFGARLTGITAEFDAVHATFAEGREESADILIGCDGIGSPTRTHIDAHAPIPRYSGLVRLGGFARVVGLPPTLATTQHVVFGRRSFFGYLVRTAASVGYRAPSHRGRASGGVLSYASDDDDGGLTARCASSSEEDGTVYWFANITAPEPPRGSLRDVSAAVWLDRLHDLHQDDPYPVPQIIDSHRGDLGAYPIYDLSGVPRWSRGRVVAVGDAVHATSASAGQGASLALEDAQALAMCLREGADHEAAFARYQAMRQPRADKVVQYARKINSQKRVSKSRVAVAIRDAMLPLFLKRAANDRSNDWLLQLPREGGSTARSILIKATLGDVLHDAVGHQVPDRLMLLHPKPAGGRGDRQCRDLEQGDFVMGQLSDDRGIKINSRAGTAYKVGKIENRIHLVPREDLRQRIGAGDEVHVHVIAALDA